MPTFVNGQLWDEIGKANLILVTTNASVRKDGCLVCGRGAAKEAAERFPTFSRRCGHKIRFYEREEKIYGIMIFSGILPQGSIGAFQVKYHWKDQADLLLIAHSVGQLILVSGQYERIAMNFPGTGFGRLAREKVLPLLEPLPDNVIIYEYEK